MTLKQLLTFFVLLQITIPAFTQTYSVKGFVTDAKDKSPIPGADAMLIRQPDSLKLITLTDGAGYFLIDKVRPGNYLLRISFLGYKTFEKSIVVQKSLDMGLIRLSDDLTKLNEIKIIGKLPPVTQKSDTTEMNAGAYKTNKDANAEDLVTKMPGITSSNGTVTAHGEQVKKVLIDGKEFFGDDPSMALKNLPAEVIEKIQVFDRMSEQARFTGYDDGNSQKTINIVTKRGRNEGQFGKVYGSYGNDDKYLAGGNLNIFKGNRKISILALSNNVNQQNFSSQDISGATGGNQQRGFGGGGGFGGPGGGGGGPGGNSANNFLVGQQNGITTTHALGLNYIDSLGSHIGISGSYFFSLADNKNTNDLSRYYFTSKDSGLVYNENDILTNRNINQRANLRLEYKFDTFTSIVLTPSFSLQQYNSATTQIGQNVKSENDTISRTNNRSGTPQLTAYNFSNDLLFRHKFMKPGRTISVNLGTQANNKTASTTLYSNIRFDTSATIIDQQATNPSNGYTLSTNIVYTEPLSKVSNLMFTYNPSYNYNKQDKQTFNFNDTTHEYSSRVDSLSNTFSSTYIIQRGGLAYRFSNPKIILMTALNFQEAMLSANQLLPQTLTINRTFDNFLPNGFFNYKISKEKNLRVYYRTSTNAPGITQLQNVVNNSNPLLLSIGNPDLKQSYSHFISTRYGITNGDKASNFLIFLNGTYTFDYIASSTRIYNNGRQLTMPVNLDGYISGSSFLTYGFPVKFLKSNLNLSTGVTYSRTPSLINDASNLANTYNLSQGIVIASNISEKIDFTVSTTGTYYIVKNTLRSSLDNNYYNQAISVKFNWVFLGGFVVNTALTHTLYTGLSQGFNQNYLLWNASAGYKFFKNQALDVRLSVFDLLNQNTSISRNVTASYIEDSRTLVLKQYFMINVVYTIRNFKMR